MNLSATMMIPLASPVSNTAPQYAHLPVKRSLVMLIDPPEHYLKQPIILNVERTEEGYWLANNPDVLTYGTGDTVKDAVEDFQSMLVDLFLELVESEDILAPDLLQQLEYLRSFLVEENFTNQWC
jgi:hypothetical protein